MTDIRSYIVSGHCPLLSEILLPMVARVSLSTNPSTIADKLGNQQVSHDDDDDDTTTIIRLFVRDYPGESVSEGYDMI